MGSNSHPPGSSPNTAASQQQQYCLKWNNHQSNLLKVFNRLLGSEQFTDVLLAAEGKTLRGHKVVLSACSSYFEELFTSFNEKNQIVILKDTKFSDLSAIIEFMYKGEISVIQDQLSSLLKTAENLKVKGLAEVSGDEKSSSKSQPSKPSLLELGGSSSSGAGTKSSSSKGFSSEGRPKYVESSPRCSLSPPPPPPSAKKRGRPRLSDIRGEQTGSGKNSAVSSGGGGYYKKRSSEVASYHHHHTHSSAKSSADPSSFLNNKVESLIRSVEDGMAEEELIKTEELSYINEDGAPTPGGPLTLERIQDLGVIKMNEYLMSGTRQQFWDEYFIKVVMQGVRNKEIDMKSAAEILGVSYGTLYGRYRETFGYLKHAWNVGGRPPKISSSSPGSKDLGLMTMWTDPQNEDILEQLKQGRLTIKQAADMLGMEPSVLDYHLTGKTGKMYMDDEDELMEVQPDIILRHEETDPIEIEED